MVLAKVAEELTKRRNELVKELNDDSIKIEKQHQIYGAINEIDLFLQTLNHISDKSDKEIGPITLVKPLDENKDTFSRLLGSIKKKVKRKV